MSGITSADNLKKAHRIKQLGYNSLLEARPNVTRAFLNLWQEGYSLRKCRERLLEEFPSEDVPSINAFSNYLKNHSNETFEGRKAVYVRRTAEFDSLHELYKVAVELDGQYAFAKAGRMPFHTKLALLKEKAALCQKLLEIEMHLGIRDQSGLPNPKYGQALQVDEGKTPAPLDPRVQAYWDSIPKPKQ